MLTYYLLLIIGVRVIDTRLLVFQIFLGIQNSVFRYLTDHNIVVIPNEKKTACQRSLRYTASNL